MGDKKAMGLERRGTIQADKGCVNNRFTVYDRLEQRYVTVDRRCHSDEGWDGKEKPSI